MLIREDYQEKLYSERSRNLVDCIFFFNLYICFFITKKFWIRLEQVLSKTRRMITLGMILRKKNIEQLTFLNIKTCVCYLNLIQ